MIRRETDLPLVFFDTEFTELSPAARWISIGLISEDGEHEFYAELSDTWTDGDLSEFAKAEVSPHLGATSDRISQAELSKRLTEWLGALGGTVRFATDSEDWDWLWLRQLWSNPTQWPKNLYPHPYVLLFDAEFGERFADAVDRAFATGSFRRHHALDDAKVNRLGWLAVTRYS